MQFYMFIGLQQNMLYILVREMVLQLDDQNTLIKQRAMNV
jgi:hypothetical protein